MLKLIDSPELLRLERKTYQLIFCWLMKHKSH
jgi:hypothetical protein